MRNSVLNKWQEKKNHPSRYFFFVSFHVYWISFWLCSSLSLSRVLSYKLFQRSTYILDAVFVCVIRVWISFILTLFSNPNAESNVYNCLLWKDLWIALSLHQRLLWKDFWISKRSGIFKGIPEMLTRYFTFFTSNILMEGIILSTYLIAT